MEREYPTTAYLASTIKSVYIALQGLVQMGRWSHLDETVLRVSRDICEVIGVDPDKMINVEKLEKKILDKMKIDEQLLTKPKGEC